MEDFLVNLLTVYFWGAGTNNWFLVFFLMGKIQSRYERIKHDIDAPLYLHKVASSVRSTVKCQVTAVRELNKIKDGWMFFVQSQRVNLTHNSCNLFIFDFKSTCNNT